MRDLSFSSTNMATITYRENQYSDSTDRSNDNYELTLSTLIESLFGATLILKPALSCASGKSKMFSATTAEETRVFRFRTIDKFGDLPINR